MLARRNVYYIYSVVESLVYQNVGNRSTERPEALMHCQQHVLTNQQSLRCTEDCANRHDMLHTVLHAAALSDEAHYRRETGCPRSLKQIVI